MGSQSPPGKTILPSATIASAMFIVGEPMKPPTKRVAGWWNTSSGVPSCSISPSRMMTMRSASVIAST